MTIEEQSWKSRTQAIEQKLRAAGCKLRPMDLEHNPASREMSKRGVQRYIEITRPDGKRFWLTWWSKRTRSRKDATRTNFWMCATDEAPTKQNGPWYTWEYERPSGPITVTLHQEKPPEGTKNVELYQNPMVRTDEKYVFRWFDTVIAAGRALQAQDMGRPRRPGMNPSASDTRPRPRARGDEPRRKTRA